MLRVLLVGIGRLKAGLERELATRYLDRAASAGRSLGFVIEMREIDESRARRAEDRKRDEAQRLGALIPAAAEIVALDEAGRAVDSRGFSHMIGTSRDLGRGSLALIIGGADGLDRGFRDKADHVIAFGTMTWPHQLVRVMAAEQIYRSVTILAGHPYHRA